MGSSAHLPCYLVEWYRPRLGDEAFERTAARLDHVAAVGASVRLLLTVAAPDDEVLFAVFAAESADDVASACRDVGLPAQRLSDAVVDARPVAEWGFARGPGHVSRDPDQS